MLKHSFVREEGEIPDRNTVHGKRLQHGTAAETGQVSGRSPSVSAQQQHSESGRCKRRQVRHRSASRPQLGKLEVFTLPEPGIIRITAKLDLLHIRIDDPGDISDVAIHRVQSAQFLQTAQVRRVRDLYLYQLQLFKIRHEREEPQVIRSHVELAPVFLPEPTPVSRIFIRRLVAEILEPLVPAHHPHQLARLHPPIPLCIILKVIAHDRDAPDLGQVFFRKARRQGIRNLLRCLRDSLLRTFRRRCLHALCDHKSDQRNEHCPTCQKHDRQPALLNRQSINNTVRDQIRVTLAHGNDVASVKCVLEVVRNLRAVHLQRQHILRAASNGTEQSILKRTVRIKVLREHCQNSVPRTTFSLGNGDPLCP